MPENQIIPLLEELQSSDEPTRLVAAEQIARHPDRQVAAIELVKAASDTARHRRGLLKRWRT